jgi:hypothetical protein
MRMTKVARTQAKVLEATLRTKVATQAVTLVAAPILPQAAEAATRTISEV